MPYYAQIASPELAQAIFAEGLDPILDPRWEESGAASPEEYAYWVERACGVACLKMAVEALGGPVRSLIEWARIGVETGGYLVRRSPDGTQREVGWVHAALVRMAQREGLSGEARPASLGDIVKYLREDKLVIASVSYEAGDDRLSITKQGGHLMVVTGTELVNGQPVAFFVNNPSGRRPELQAGARLKAKRFTEGYSGRIIVLGALP